MKKISKKEYNNQRKIYEEREKMINSLSSKLKNVKEITSDKNRISLKFLDNLFVHIINKGEGSSLSGENIFFYDEDFKVLKLFLKGKKLPKEFYWMSVIFNLLQNKITQNSYKELPNYTWKKTFVNFYKKFNKFSPEKEFFLFFNEFQWRYKNNNPKIPKDKKILITDKSAYLLESTSTKNRILYYTLDNFSGYFTKDNKLILDRSKLQLKQKGKKIYYDLKDGIKEDDCEKFTFKNVDKEVYTLVCNGNDYRLKDKKGIIKISHPDLLCYSLE